jgi:hypothetical protein
MQKQRYMGLAIMVVSGVALAAESRVTGNLQIQGAYLEPAPQSDGRWFLQAPNSWLGLEVIESVSGSQYRGVIEADLDPLAFDNPVSARAVFIEWVQPLYSVRGGQLRSLEQRLLIDPIDLMHGFDGIDENDASDTELFVDALAVENRTASLSQPSMEITASNGELMYVSGQWTFADESSASTLEQWAVAAGLDTPEGRVALVYRRNDDFDAGLWGYSILWQSDGLQLGATALYREEILAWDLIGGYQAGTVTTKVSYGRDEQSGQPDGARYWAFGVDQVFSDSVLNYSEIRWQPEPDQWRWMTGFRLSF